MSDFRDGDQWAEDCEHWRGRLLVGVLCHWCADWDDLPVDETTMEIDCCGCDLSELIEHRIGT